jgi:hypothetical protein
MAEEDVRVATRQVATTYARVDELYEEMKKLDKELKEWKRLNPEYLFDERLKVIYKDMQEHLNEARADLDKARADLDKANESLKGARAYIVPMKKQRIEEFDQRYLSAYIAAAQGLSLEESGKRIAVPQAIFGVAFDSDLFIRQEYLNVAEIIKATLASDLSIRRILVLGSPGIGKSVFGVLLFLLAIKERKDVAYHPNHFAVTYYFTWNGAEYDISNFPHPGKIYDGYFDGKECGDALRFDCFRHVYLFSSPRSTNYNDFVKEKCFKIYMNPWSKEECEKFAENISFDDEDEWLRRFNLVGGKPRFLFSSSIKFEDLAERVEMDLPLNANEMKDQVRLFELNVFDDRMKHIVFSLYRSTTGPSRSFLTYSSLIVEVMMKARYAIGTPDEIRMLLQIPATNSQSWRGRDIEKFLLQDVATAAFRIKSLEGPDEGEAKLVGPFMASSRIIHAASEIGNQLMFNIPLSKTFPAIDGVLVVPAGRLVIYIQSTVSTAHPIKFSLLKNVYDNLTQRHEFKGYRHILLFIVSNDIFDSFRFQPYKNADGKEDCTVRIDIELKQYVGKVGSSFQY